VVGQQIVAMHNTYIDHSLGAKRRTRALMAALSRRFCFSLPSASKGKKLSTAFTPFNKSNNSESS
jgi:hypothetical protein